MWGRAARNAIARCIVGGIARDDRRWLCGRDGFASSSREPRPIRQAKGPAARGDRSFLLQRAGVGAGAGAAAGALAAGGGGGTALPLAGGGGGGGASRPAPGGGGGGGSAEEVGRGMEEGKGHGWGGGERGAFQLNDSLTLDRLSRPFPIDKNTTGCKKVITLINLYACTT